MKDRYWQRQEKGFDLDTVLVFIVFVLTFFLFMPKAGALECRALAERMLVLHPRLEAAKRDVQVASANVKRLRGGWFPDMRVNGVLGPEYRKSANGGTRTDMTAQTLTVTLNQLVWDFGKTNAEIAKTDLALTQAELKLNDQRDELLLDSATACINLSSSYRSLAMAEESVANIRKQTGLEESRVELGGGLLTDALQARSQLSGAQARQARAQGTLNKAINRFRYLFSTEPESPDPLNTLGSPQHLLPTSLEGVLEAAGTRNVQIQIAMVGATISQMEKERVVSAEFAPRIGASVEKKYKDDAEGVDGNQQELTAKLELSKSFNFGLSSFHSLSGAREDMAAAENRLMDTRNEVEEKARNGWESLKTAQENAGFLENQARISAEFLRMAKEERLQGGRSLIDVLSGETGLINAQIDAVAAQAEVAISQFSLLKIMGLLDLDALTGVPASVPNKTETSRTESSTPLPTVRPPEDSKVSEKTVTDAPYMVRLTKVSRLREKPDGNSRTLKKLGVGVRVQVVGKSEDGKWLHLDNDAWIASELVKPE
ncbi:MAG: hypothetical protein HW380_2495 [Magnetococcales bacterium]|nr:hypothetical protein [Magnetococcales bacterium]